MFRLIAFVSLICASTSLAEFIHPGVAHSQGSIDFVKSKIKAGEEPWSTAWKKVKGGRSADLERTPEPHAHVERGPYNNPNIGSSEFSRDAAAAYTQALCWALSGDEARKEEYGNG